MGKMNCWEIKKCGREAGGLKVAELGACPASVEAKTDGINSGRNGGRCCWAIAGTLCGGRVQGTFASKQLNCNSCEFYKSVKEEEGSGFSLISQIRARV